MVRNLSRDYLRSKAMQVKATFLFPTLAEIPAPIKAKKMRGGKLYRFSDYNLLCTGVGKNIQTSIEKIAGELEGNILVLLGYAGGLSPGLQSGDLVICEEFITHRHPPITPHQCNQTIKKWLEKENLPVSLGKSYTSEQIVNQKDEKKRLAQEGATVVEMENYWAAETAARLKIPIISIRMVLDTFAEELPDMSATLKANGEISISGVLHYLLKRPDHIGTMFKIFLTTRRILPHLHDCCSLISTRMRNSL